MKNWITQIVDKKRRSVKPLTTEERQNLRKDFLRFIDTHPLPMAQPVSLLESLRLFWQRPLAHGIPQIALIALFLSGSSVAYMAEHASPGDALYGVKRSVNEELLMRISAFSPSLRAEMNSKLLARRLEEVAQVIAHGTEDEAPAQTLRTDIDTRTRAIQAHIAQVQKSGEVDEALAAGAKLDALLDTHNSRLYRLWTARGDENRSANVEAFIMQIEEERSELQEIREDLLAMRTEEVETSDAQIELTEPYKELSELLDAWRTKYEVQKDTLTEEDAVLAETLLNDAADALKKADSAEKDHDPKAALQAFETVVVKLQEIATLLTPSS